MSDPRLERIRRLSAVRQKSRDLVALSLASARASAARATEEALALEEEFHRAADAVQAMTSGSITDLLDSRARVTHERSRADAAQLRKLSMKREEDVSRQALAKAELESKRMERWAELASAEIAEGEVRREQRQTDELAARRGGLVKR